MPCVMRLSWTLCLMMPRACLVSPIDWLKQATEMILGKIKCEPKLIVYFFVTTLWEVWTLLHTFLSYPFPWKKCEQLWPLCPITYNLHELLVRLNIQLRSKAYIGGVVKKKVNQGMWKIPRFEKSWWKRWKPSKKKTKKRRVSEIKCVKEAKEMGYA